MHREILMQLTSTLGIDMASQVFVINKFEEETSRKRDGLPGANRFFLAINFHMMLNISKMSCSGSNNRLVPSQAFLVSTYIQIYPEYKLRGQTSSCVKKVPSLYGM